jgi:coproporphyrinogen III oxidase-like Fe-S oxidoreductase
VRSLLSLSEGAETTLEANPESIDPDKLDAYRRAGINRISIGVQSFDRGVLQKLGRRHSPERAEQAVREAAGVFENVAVDLIYGARRSTTMTARVDAERVAKLPVVHVSAYALTLDREVLAEEVPLARMRAQGRLELPNDAETLQQARAIRGVLRRAGFRRYEISNFARFGAESKHNALYWAGESYLGLGAGAFGCRHSGASAIRYSNHRAPERWLADLEAGALPVAEEDRLNWAQIRNEKVMLGLRTARGIDLEYLPERLFTEVEQMVKAGLARRSGGRLVLTTRGWDVHSAVSERLFE